MMWNNTQASQVIPVLPDPTQATLHFQLLVNTLLSQTELNTHEIIFFSKSIREPIH